MARRRSRRRIAFGFGTLVGIGTVAAFIWTAFFQRRAVAAVPGSLQEPLVPGGAGPWPMTIPVTGI